MIVLLNGPPRSGKDMLANKITRQIANFEKRRFKDALVDITSAIYRVPKEMIEEMLEDSEGKEKPSEVFDGLSLRQALIDVSENVVKPRYGKNYFGHATAKTMRKNVNYAISDSGFVEEAKVIVDRFGGQNVVLIRLHRNGCDFSNDSRSYLPVDMFTHVANLQNNSSKHEILEQVIDVIELAQYKNGEFS